MTERNWPVALEGVHNGTIIRLRGLRGRKDRKAFMGLRRDNAEWTKRWDSTSPYPRMRQVSYAHMVREQEREAKAGRLLPLMIDLDGRMTGQIHLFNIVRGALQSGSIGYWIDERAAGRGVVPFALAMVIDHAFGPMGLHRVEVNIRPDNAKSLRVVDKLGLRDEGVRRAYLHIDNEWHDHRSFALTLEDLAGESAQHRLYRLSQQ
ncbi:GNAT family N-acetyltransferase [Luteipulveratus mongoliensis]|uniref:Alanine acetyltransferase n=1 Tax=Luteipulveratus mongoliensis TaxID=571913 RepID=A0A0K1JGN4_9MICO|nr:GNAT family protein [Luteipulveratus mongoliensis]AKU15874.1 alanine acetyltransferase [Luteipulveratus mongoliensis]